MPKYTRNKKTVAFNLNEYPFKRCHLHCDNNCTANKNAAIPYIEMRQKLEPDFDEEGEVFLKLIGCMGKKKHSINMPEEDPQIEKYLQLLKIKDASKIKKLFTSYPIIGHFNSCTCCKEPETKTILATIRNKRFFSYPSMYILDLGHGHTTKIDENDLKKYSQEDQTYAINDEILLSVPAKVYLGMLEHILWCYVFDRETNFVGLPCYTNLFLSDRVETSNQYLKLSQKLSPIGQLMDSWLVDKKGVYFIPASCMTISNYNHKLGVWPRQRYSNKLSAKHIWRFKTFLWTLFDSYNGTVVVPEDSELFRHFLKKINLLST